MSALDFVFTLLLSRRVKSGHSCTYGQDDGLAEGRTLVVIGEPYEEARDRNSCHTRYGIFLLRGISSYCFTLDPNHYIVMATESMIIPR